jgi:hypothetical protein
MKSILTNTVGILIMLAGSAFADSGAGADENGWLWMLFLGFGALIVVLQLVPAVILCGSMIKGLIGSPLKLGSATAEARDTIKS